MEQSKEVGELCERPYKWVPLATTKLNMEWVIKDVKKTPPAHNMVGTWITLGPRQVCAGVGHRG